MRSRRLPLVAALLLTLLVGCGGAGGTTHLASGQEGGPDEPAATSAPPTTTAPPRTTAPPTTATSTTTAPTTTAPAVPPTTAAAPIPEGSDASPVDGLTAEELVAAVTAPQRGRTARPTSPTVDQVVLADGTRVWRVRVPGAFPARSARVTVSVGGREVGQGITAPDLGAITAVTTDGTGLRAGAAVSYQWEGSPPVAAGTLEVAR